METGRTISLRERIRINLITAMENAGINQVQLADKLNISKGTVNNWTRGNNSPDRPGSFRDRRQQAHHRH